MANNIKSPCWHYAGSIDKDGYGTISVHLPNGNTTSARIHRVTYEEVHGPIARGYQIDHLCKIRNCINPDHLEAVTPRENIYRSSGIAVKNSQKTGCLKGHRYTVDNLYVSPKGSRECKSCRRIASKLCQRRRRELARA